MADIQAQDDVEQAPTSHLSNEASHPPGALGRDDPPGPMKDDIADKVIVLSFRNLQLKRIGALQDKLIALSLRLEPLSPDHADQVDNTLRAYAQALRDYETLSVNTVPSIPIGAHLVGSMGIAGEERRNTHNGTIVRGVAKLASRMFPGLLPALDQYMKVVDSFNSLSTSSFTWYVCDRALRIIMLEQGSTNFGPSTAVNFMEGSCGKLGFRELDQQGRLRRAKRKALIQRMVMGLFGGVALICPVLVMVLYSSRNTNLITVSVATILFACILAIGASDATGKDILAATAAYAAVLVVFFGTNGS